MEELTCGAADTLSICHTVNCSHTTTTVSSRHCSLRVNLLFLTLLMFHSESAELLILSVT